MCFKGFAQRFQFGTRSQWDGCNVEATIVPKWFPQFETFPAQFKLTEDFFTEDSKWPLAKCDVSTRDRRNELASGNARQKVIGNLEINESPFFVASVIDFHEG